MAALCDGHFSCSHVRCHDRSKTYPHRYLAAIEEADWANEACSEVVERLLSEGYEIPVRNLADFLPHPSAR
jgi:hypothetical protein